MILFEFNQVPHHLSIEQILRLLAAAKEHDHLHWLSMAVTFNHALRASEVVRMKPACVVDGKLVMSRSKHSNDVNDKLRTHANSLLDERQALLELVEKTPANSRLFPVTTRTFQRWVNAAGERAGLPNLLCHPHVLKHSVLYFLRRNGLNTDELAPQSGHKSVDSLKIYTDLTPEETQPLVDAAFARIGA